MDRLADILTHTREKLALYSAGDIARLRAQAYARVLAELQLQAALQTPAQQKAIFKQKASAKAERTYLDIPFYGRLVARKAAEMRILIAEFKRRSPSNSSIGLDADLPTQVLSYAENGADVISVLTNEQFFGGSLGDLALARQTLLSNPQAPLLLRKDFILHPLQLYQAKLAGADAVLLIAAALPASELASLKAEADALRLGVLLELHDKTDLKKTSGIIRNFPVLGVNNRDLRSFNLRRNRANALATELPSTAVLIAESGIEDEIDYQLATHLSHGALIGTSMMQGAMPFAHSQVHSHVHSEDLGAYQDSLPDAQAQLATDREHVTPRATTAAYAGSVDTRSHRQPVAADRLGQDILNEAIPKPFLLKACGARSLDDLLAPADLIGVNFSEQSKRKFDISLLEGQVIPPNAVALFYDNPFEEVLALLARFPFRWVQLYADDVTTEQLARLPARVLLAIRATTAPEVLATAHHFAYHVDGFVLDSPEPGSGKAHAVIPPSFPYPFFLAGGMNEHNLHRLMEHPHCIGMDAASGVEEQGAFSAEKVRKINQLLRNLFLVEPE